MNQLYSSSCTKGAFSHLNTNKAFAVRLFNLIYIEMKCLHTIAESILITSFELSTGPDRKR